MEQIFEKFSATELDNVLHAINKYESGEGYSPEEIQTNIWLDGKIAPPMDGAIVAIVNYKSDLITITKSGKMGKRYKPGPYLEKFLYYGGFKGIYEQQIADSKRSTAERETAHQANLATIDAAASAKRSADASAVSAGAAERSANAADRSANLAKQALIVAVIAALLSLAAFIKSFFD
jgi:hypothetical protein